MKKIFFAFLSVVSVFLIFIGSAFAATPFFTSNFSGERLYNVGDDASITGTLDLKNLDGENTITLRLYSDADPLQGFVFTPDQEFITLQPFASQSVDFTFDVLEGACDGSYRMIMYSKLASYTNASTLQNFSFGTAVGIALRIIVSAGNNCSQPNGGYVFYDKDGDGVYEPSYGETLITKGNVYIYDSGNALLRSTDLSVTNGQYNLPFGSVNGQTTLLIVVDTAKYQNVENTILDKTWEGNLYINRNIDYPNITSYSVIGDLDMRSRNTDQSGSWSSSTISIGPDDKDQIISPSRWDQTVAGTDFAYADLDFDGRIDPDDKDQIISPMYWDFPN